MPVDHEALIAMLDRLKLTAIRDQLDTLLDEAARSEMTLREALMPKGSCVCSALIWLAIIKSAAWSRCPRLMRRTANASIVSASILCRTGPD